MPLTFAHPAAALPLRRLGLPLSALVVGCMAPDFVYFLRLSPRGDFGHTLPGIGLFCLPAGMALLWTFHRVLKRPLLALAPERAQRKAAPWVASTPFAQPLWRVATAVVLGALTHVAWDAFTHADGAGVARLPVLRQTVDLGVFGLDALGPVAGFKVAQHGSTLVGLGALAAATVRWWRGAREVPTEIRLSVRMRRRRLGKLLAGAGIAGAVFGAAHAAFASNPLPVFAGRFVVATTSAACLGALGYGLWTLRGRGV